MSDTDQDARDKQILEKHCQQLMEHFDSVQVFVTRHDPVSDETMSHCNGSGHWFARFGQVDLWVVRHKEHARVHMRKECDEDSP